MRKRITLLIAALMLALTMALGAGAAFAASPLAEECAANGGTFDSATKTCTYPVGNSGKEKTATFHDAGNGDQTGRTGPNGQSLPY
jgi:hypothetical protein